MALADGTACKNKSGAHLEDAAVALRIVLDFFLNGGAGN